MTTPSSGGRTKLRPNGGDSPKPPRLRSVVRISIDREAIAALDKQALAAQLGIGLVARWLASWIVEVVGCCDMRSLELSAHS